MLIKYLHSKRNNPTAVPVILILFAAPYCQKEYKLNDLDNHEKIPVINGTLTNGNDTCTVLVSWAIPFDEPGTEYIANAVVSLEDIHGNRECLTSKDWGRYYTSSDTTKLALGSVEYSTRTVDYHGIYWDGLNRDYKNIRLANYQIPDSSGLQSGIMPDFFIDFRLIPW